ncbi:flagellar hook capping FlgD N-terminal domain-containing protein [Sphingomonas sp.]|uniref:flagellar hook assembly protein FlgD n=1 Tax=Sphingomonas sp. TaxID=28214 RepID=UPI0025CEE4F1|nr:flagellar hook capping FlgD N-terminal domain-containing protein [Sphingomonas sp.]
MTNAIDSRSIAALNATTKSSGSGTLDQTSFLKLMTTQLQTQDPFEPMDNTQMVAQMAQFSSVAGISEMNASLKSIAAKLDAGRVGDAAAWIGKSALIAGDFVNRGTDGTYAGQVTLDAPADRLTIDLLDGAGLIVHSETLGKSEGTTTFKWDGNGEGGTATGPLRVRVTAKNKSATVATTTNIWTPITAVQSPAGGSAQRLVTPNGLIAPEAAIRLG